ncbi:hypothetical protein [Bradyrhizobium sp. STM 3557]|uniref:hypothetical protein n=1 Tax=Bradyrhizobium sp. STM 3557 TaxID=578920 RepID=UPI00389116A3
MQSEVGGVALAALSPERAAPSFQQFVSTATLGCGENAMRNVTDLLMRFWPERRPAFNTQVTVMAENRDRSSMADFVRILQTYDQAQYGRR